MGYVNTPRGRRYKANDGKLYGSYEQALAAQGLTINPYTGKLAPTPGRVFSDLLQGAQSAGRGASTYINESLGALVGPTGVGERQDIPVPNRIRNSGLLSPEEASRLGAPPAPVLPSPEEAALMGAVDRVSGLDRSGQVDRRQSDLYRQYAARPFTPQGQFERYFGTGEMDPFFGSSSRGAGAPKTSEEMMSLAAQQKAPMDTPLATYYRAQSAAGRAEMPTIIEGLGYGKGTPLAQWAEANPMLAKRLYEKEAAKKQSAPGPDIAEFGARAQEPGGYAETMATRPGLFTPGIANPVPPTEDRSGTGLTQGQKMDLNRGVTNLQPQQAAKTSGAGMPPFETTGEKVDDFFGRIGLDGYKKLPSIDPRVLYGQ
jgi:hypothetical protein